MPESRCQDCNQWHYEDTTEKLQSWELEHHIASYTLFDTEESRRPSEGYHKCQGFEEYLDATGKMIACRVYNHNHLRENRPISL